MTHTEATSLEAMSCFEGFNLRLGSSLFSDPQRERSNAVVVANHPDETAMIKAGDLLRMDFTDTQLSDGLYVISFDDEWIGYRMFQRMPTLHMLDSRNSYPVTAEMLASIKVIGKVKDIYRSTSEEKHHV